MNIVTYVKKNYDKLPKSTFNDDELVIVLEINKSDEGWGNHSYQGVGVNRAGEIYWCYSSGCSCSGSCGMDHRKDMKVLQAEGFDLSGIDWKEVNFESISVDYRDYD